MKPYFKGFRLRWRSRTALLPEYRLSKFQRVLPEAWQVELVGSYLLDFDGTAEWLARARDGS